MPPPRGFQAGLVEALIKGDGPAYAERDTEMGLMPPMIRVAELEVISEPLVILLRGNAVITLYRRGQATRFQKFGRYAETAMKKADHKPARRPHRLLATM